MRPSIAVGEIWLVSLDDVEGHEQRGTRPALVIATHRRANLAMATPFTGNMDALRFPYSYDVKPSIINGLTTDSAVLVYQTRCLALTRFIRKIGDLEPAHFNNVKLLLKDYCGI